MSLKVVKKVKRKGGDAGWGWRDLCVAKTQQDRHGRYRSSVVQMGPETTISSGDDGLFAPPMCGRNARLQPLLGRNQIEIEYARLVA
jgi:hypothetical protein